MYTLTIQKKNNKYTNKLTIISQLLSSELDSIQ